MSLPRISKDLPEEEVEALTHTAKKLVVRDLKRRKQLIREQVSWENSRATDEEKEEFLQKVLFRFADIFTVHDDEISNVDNKDAEFEIKTKRDPIYMRPRLLTPATLAAVNEEVKKTAENGTNYTCRWTLVCTDCCSA